MSRSRAVQQWTKMAIDKYYLGFVITDSISESYKDYRAFFYAHGLEMLCKAYIIGDRYPEYRDLSFHDAKVKLDKIARDLRHDLENLVKKSIYKSVPPSQFLNDVHCRNNINEVDLTNLEMLNVLKTMYSEARYPVVEPDFKLYYQNKLRNNRGAINRRYPLIIKDSHELEKFSIKLFKLILKAIERDFRLKICRKKFSSDIKDNDWARFSNLFFT